MSDDAGFVTVHYSLTERERRALSTSGEGAQFDRAEMLCRTGNAHAVGTRVVSSVNCPRCKQTLDTWLKYWPQ
jgi:hypothetical protein